MNDAANTPDVAVATASGANPGPDKGSSVETQAAKNWRRMRIQEYALPVVVLGLVITGIIVKNGTFNTTSNFENILIQASIAGVIAVGMTFVIATGGIDLSVGSVLAVSAIFGAQLATGGTWHTPFGTDVAMPEWGLLGFFLGTVFFGALVGAFNGAAVVWFRIIPFIATLATMTICRGLALNFSGKTPVSLYKFDDLLQIGSGRWLGIPIPAFILLAVTLVGWVLLNRTRYGRYVVAVGGNREAARIAGIRVRQIVFSVYVLVGVCTAIAAIITTGQLGSAAPQNGVMLELQAIAAVAIGGTALVGGRATMVGTFFGVLTFAIIFNLLTLLGMPAELQSIVQGLIILVAVAVQRRES